MSAMNMYVEIYILPSKKKENTQVLLINSDSKYIYMSLIEYYEFWLVGDFDSPVTNAG